MSFTSNVGLQALQQAWNEHIAHFADDRYAAHSVEDVLAEGEAQMTKERQVDELVDMIGDRAFYQSSEGFSGRAPNCARPMSVKPPHGPDCRCDINDYRIDMEPV